MAELGADAGVEVHQRRVVNGYGSTTSLFSPSNIGLYDASALKRQQQSAAFVKQFEADAHYQRQEYSRKHPFKKQLHLQKCYPQTVKLLDGAMAGREMPKRADPEHQQPHQLHMTAAQRDKQDKGAREYHFVHTKMELPWLPEDLLIGNRVVPPLSYASLVSDDSFETSKEYSFLCGFTKEPFYVDINVSDVYDIYRATRLAAKASTAGNLHDAVRHIYKATTLRMSQDRLKPDANDILALKTYPPGADLTSIETSGSVVAYTVNKFLSLFEDELCNVKRKIRANITESPWLDVPLDQASSLASFASSIGFTKADYVRLQTVLLVHLAMFRQQVYRDSLLSEYTLERRESMGYYKLDMTRSFKTASSNNRDGQPHLAAWDLSSYESCLVHALILLRSITTTGAGKSSAHMFLAKTGSTCINQRDLKDIFQFVGREYLAVPELSSHNLRSAYITKFVASSLINTDNELELLAASVQVSRRSMLEAYVAPAFNNPVRKLARRIRDGGMADLDDDEDMEDVEEAEEAETENREQTEGPCFEQVLGQIGYCLQAIALDSHIALMCAQPCLHDNRRTGRDQCCLRRGAALGQIGGCPEAIALDVRITGMRTQPCHHDIRRTGRDQRCLSHCVEALSLKQAGAQQLQCVASAII
ncbi:hypothetical protein JKP88DRAFT_267610 [Tribonema minus]|uniref:Uncharacterized protein n=1 Tax=Tribonema minus TaxID=303371 RepID=A0A835Z766_9STRA|nr:hypothetical protein JKP88DRAFT_267610 [Tribonema minus]